MGEDKQRKLPFYMMYAHCLSSPSASLALQNVGFVPREWQAAKDLSLNEAEYDLKNYTDLGGSRSA